MISTLNGSILATVRSALESRSIVLGDAREHGGRLTIAELEKIGAYSPAFFLTVQRIRDVKKYGKDLRQFTVDYGSFVVCTGSADKNRDEQALEIVEHLIAEKRGIIPGNRWEQSFCKAVEHQTVEATNLYSGEAGSQGVAIWGVSWEQFVDTGLTA